MIDMVKREDVLGLYNLGRRIDSAVISRIFDERDRLQDELENLRANYIALKQVADKRKRELASYKVNHTLIGQKVRKKTNKPFKSSLKVNTIKGVVTHTVTKRDAYTFEEDDSMVEVHRCKIVPND